MKKFGLLVFVFVLLLVSASISNSDGPRFTGISQQGDEVLVTFDFGTNTNFRLERAVGPTGGYQPFTPGEILGVEFPAPNTIRWRLSLSGLVLNQRTFRVVSLN